MTTYYTLQDRFQYELSELYSVQKNSLTILQQISGETSDTDLKNLIGEITRATDGLLTAIEGCFKDAGIESEKVTGETVMGLRQEHALLDSTRASQSQIDTYDLHAVARIVAYEAAAYRALVDTARLLHLSSCETSLQSGLTAVEGWESRLQSLRGQIGQATGSGV